MRNFKSLKIWNEGMQFVEEIYSLTRQFPKEEQFGLKLQLTCAAISIPSNIAEGCGRQSNTEFLRFLEIAYSSGYELETQLEIAARLKLAEEEKINALIHQVKHLQVMIHNYRIHLKKKYP
jgi:four helix bundle protein